MTIATVLAQLGPKLASLASAQSGNGRGMLSSAYAQYGKSLQFSSQEPPPGMGEAERVKWRQNQRQERLKGIKIQEEGGGADRLGSAMGNLSQLNSQINPFGKSGTQAASGLLSGAGSALQSAGHPAAIAAGTALKFTAALVESIDKLRNWGNQLHENNMQFAEYSASMARVQAASEVQEFYLKQQQGERRAQSAEYLSEGRSDMNKAFAPLENLWAKAENYISGGLMKYIAKLMIPVTIIADFLDSATSDGDTGDGIDASRWAYELAQGDHERVIQSRPPRMR